MEFNLGDIIRMKKSHPCGSSEWEILRTGADFRLKCMGCGHQIMVPRRLVEKNTRSVRSGAAGIIKKLAKISKVWYHIFRDILDIFLAPCLTGGHKTKGGATA